MCIYIYILYTSPMCRRRDRDPELKVKAEKPIKKQRK